ncbi:hypothetical protein F5879DRAFT_357259 [Lentinula edodes]|nr:hypothetical protein F5879DRAFT_357259 [Lentinula edodes]
MRSCIGRAFAWQEVRISYQEVRISYQRNLLLTDTTQMCIVLSSIVQRFDLALANPLYELQITQAITIKPKGFRGGVRSKPVKLRVVSSGIDNRNSRWNSQLPVLSASIRESVVSIARLRPDHATKLTLSRTWVHCGKKHTDVTA